MRFDVVALMRRCEANLAVGLCAVLEFVFYNVPMYWETDSRVLIQSG